MICSWIFPLFFLFSCGLDLFLPLSLLLWLWFVYCRHSWKALGFGAALFPLKSMIICIPWIHHRFKPLLPLKKTSGVILILFLFYIVGAINVIGYCFEFEFMQRKKKKIHDLGLEIEVLIWVFVNFRDSLLRLLFREENEHLW